MFRSEHSSQDLRNEDERKKFIHRAYRDLGWVPRTKKDKVNNMTLFEV